MILGTMRWLVLPALVAFGLLVAPGNVSAHADYDHSEPARDEVAPEPPAQVDVWFTQEVFKSEGDNFVRVLDEQDVQVSEGDGVVDDDDRTHISAALPPDLGPGRYVVEWMTTSDIDGDTDEGAFCFYVAVEPTAEQEAECATFDEEPEATPAATATESGIAATSTPDDGGGVDAADGDSNTGIIIGVIVAIVIVAAVVGGAAVWLRRSRT